MRLPTLATLLLCAPAAIWAADPFAGTWAMNVAKSKYTVGTPPKAQTVTIREAGEKQDTTVSVTPATGNAISYHYTVPAKGGAGEVILQRDAEGPSFDGVTSKRIDDNTRELRFTKGGKEQRTVRSVVSKDGQTMTITIKGVDQQGLPVNATAVYDRK